MGATLVAVAALVVAAAPALGASASEKQALSAAQTLKKYCRVYGPFSLREKHVQAEEGQRCRRYGPLLFGQPGIKIGHAVTCEKQDFVKDKAIRFAVTAVCEL